jgi:hypothetical protein
MNNCWILLTFDDAQLRSASVQESAQINSKGRRHIPTFMLRAITQVIESDGGMFSVLCSVRDTHMVLWLVWEQKMRRGQFFER